MLVQSTLRSRLPGYSSQGIGVVSKITPRWWIYWRVSDHLLWIHSAPPWWWIHHDYPVMNTSGSQLLCVLGTSITTDLQKNFLVTKRPGSIDSSDKFITGESWLPGVLCTSSFFCVSQFRLTPWCIHHWGVSTPLCIHHWTVTTPLWWIHREAWVTPRIIEKIWNPF